MIPLEGAQSYVLQLYSSRYISHSHKSIVLLSGSSKTIVFLGWSREKYRTCRWVIVLSGGLSSIGRAIFLLGGYAKSTAILVVDMP